MEGTAVNIQSRAPRLLAATGMGLLFGALASCHYSSDYTYPTINVPNSVAIADVDGDGSPDLLVATTADQGVIALTAIQSVICGTAIQSISTGASKQHVIATTAAETIGTAISDQSIAAVATIERIVHRSAHDGVHAGTAVE